MTTRRRNAMKKRPTSPARERGVAMLLVIVALGTGVVLSTTFMSSRNSSQGLGENAKSAASAVWSAHAAADLAAAVFQTDLDWRGAISDGVLFVNKPIAGGTASVLVRNLDGEAPTADDREFIIIARAVSGGVEERVRRVVRTFPVVPPVDAIDLTLSEFAVFARSGLTVAETGTIAVWEESPEHEASLPAKIGVGFSASSPLVIHKDATIARVALFLPTTADSALRNVFNSGRYTGGAVMPLTVPALAKHAPAEFDALPVLTNDVTIDATVATLPPANFSGSVRVINGGTLTITDENGPIYSVGDLTVDNRSSIVIRGDVRVRVTGKMEIKNRSAIEPADDASKATFFVRDSIVIDNATVGFDRALALEDQRKWDDDDVTYVNPGRFRIYMVHAGSDPQSILMQNQALLAGVVHAPRASVVIKNESAIFGRVAGDTISIDTQAAVLGDPTLDPQTAFSTTDGPLYTSTGDPIAGLVDGLNNITPDTDILDAQSIIMSTINIVPLGGKLPGGLGGQPMNPATPRDAGRARSRDWPIGALRLEARHIPAGGGGGGGGSGGGGSGGGGGGGDDGGLGVLTDTGVAAIIEN